MPRLVGFVSGRRALLCLALGAMVGCSAELPTKTDRSPLDEQLRLAAAGASSSRAFAGGLEYAITKFNIDPTSFMQGQPFDAVLAYNCEAIRLRKKGQISPCAWGVVTGRFRINPGDACYPTEAGLFTLEAICLPTSSEVVKEATAVMQVESTPEPAPTSTPSGPCVVIGCVR